MIRLRQSETYYPSYQEGHSGVTGVSYSICRLTDGYWLDFNDSTFKNSGWTSKTTSLTEDDTGFWVNTTGWAIPDLNSSYKVQFVVTDSSGTFYSSGPDIIVNDNDFRVVEGSYKEDDMLRLIVAVLLSKMDFNSGSGVVTFRDLADTKDRLSVTISGDDRTVLTISDAD